VQPARDDQPKHIDVKTAEAAVLIATAAAAATLHLIKLLSL